MSYVIDAWLERGDPQLKVTSERTGQVLVDWNAVTVRELIESGQLDVAELQSPTQDLVETLKELMLLSGVGAD
ncbi:hypothetical protein [Motiliproteus sp. MSK22-1]|uniref:hypothetical protein n=1 Tax=Motiliproteus sp. MSK22-1 TaxID=1897630 RepID=UPI0009789A5A|nr:hypothetical protein [Motiliproteus sp. MSK22-1]OMH30344.1 hypothetical protein BGP75_18340 [Motiliproteus sp. MSK22-1]